MRKICTIFQTIVLTAFLLHINAQEKCPFEKLRAMIDDGVTTVQENLYIEGIVIGEPTSLNHDKNLNSHYSYVSTAQSSRTTYIQDAEGRYGFRLKFTSTRFALIARYSKVLLNLKGLDLSKDVGYTIANISGDHLVNITPGNPTDISAKQRSISELTDEDVYTFVTLCDCEFVFKEGAYMNAYETYLPQSDINADIRPASLMDGWASLLVDKEGHTFYMLMNGRCPWRRKGSGIPKGAGNISGIIVHTTLERYGDCLGPYQIRPVAEEDIDFSAPSNYATIAGWEWMDNSQEFKTDKGALRTVTTEKIAAEVGRGWISSDIEGSMVRGVDMDNPLLEDAASFGALGGKGTVNYGSMIVRAEAGKWWNYLDDRGKSVIVEFSTEGLSGTELYLAFSFAAGLISPSSSYDYPSWWMVEYSVDGFNFAKADVPDIALHSMPWWWNSPLYGVTHMTSREAGLGMTEHLVPLPVQLLGKKKVTLRISPSCKIASTLGYEHNDRAAIRPNLKTMTYVDFGSVEVRYR